MAYLLGHLQRVDCFLLPGLGAEVVLLGLRVAVAQHRRSVAEHLVRFAFEDRAQLRSLVRLVCDQYNVVPVRVLFHALEDDEDEEEGGRGEEKLIDQKPKDDLVFETVSDES